MISNQNYHRQDYSEEVNLADLFMAIWRNKILIFIVTLSSILITGIVSIFFLKPVYHAKLNIIINMPQTYTTKYGEYELPLTTNDQYINLITSNNILVNTIQDMGYKDVTIESLRDRITISQSAGSEVQNTFEIKVAAGSPDEAKRLAVALYNNYIEFLDVMITEGAVDYYINYYSVQLSSLQVELDKNKALLEKNIELLENTPKTINQKEVLDDINSSDTNKDFIIIDDIINPNYTALELDIINIRQTINSIENNMDLYNIYIEELKDKKSVISEYYSSKNFNDINNDIFRVTTSNLYLLSEPVAPTRKSSPDISKNLLIGAVLGVALSVAIALIKEFWLRQEEGT